MLSSNIGSKIKEIRISKHLSQDQVASKADISKSSLSYIENGTNSPSLKTFESICNALGVKPSDLFASPSSETIQNQEISPEDLALLHKLKNLPDTDRKEIESYIQYKKHLNKDDEQAATTEKQKICPGM